VNCSVSAVTFTLTGCLGQAPIPLCISFVVTSNWRLISSQMADICQEGEMPHMEDSHSGVSEKSRSSF
jgi:hypothetical protein